ncbi:hypothetical protein D3C80_1545500 [compost metagenome]
MPDRTLGYAAEERMVVVGRCKQCRREAKAFARDLAGVYRRQKDYRTVLFRCSQCDTGTCEINLEPDGFDRVPERIV